MVDLTIILNIFVSTPWNIVYNIYIIGKQMYGEQSNVANDQTVGTIDE